MIGRPVVESNCHAGHGSGAYSWWYLPLGLLGVEESFEDGDNLLQSSEVDSELLRDELGRGSELRVEVFSVGASSHGGAEDGLDHPVVVHLQGLGVRLTEGVGDLLGGVGNVVGETDAGEVEATAQISLGHSNVSSTYRTSHKQPSVAVCLPVLSSLRMRSWTVWDSAGAAV